MTAGPGYVVPEAIAIKIFGDGWWQYRLWPLLAFTLLLVSLFLTVWYLGGWLSLAVLACWLWLIPQAYLTFAFEAYSEPIAALYLMVAFWLYHFSIRRKPSLGLMFFWSFLGLIIFNKVPVFNSRSWFFRGCRAGV